MNVKRGVHFTASTEVTLSYLYKTVAIVLHGEDLYGFRLGNDPDYILSIRDGIETIYIDITLIP